jgi:hypothetical protein
VVHDLRPASTQRSPRDLFDTRRHPRQRRQDRSASTQRSRRDLFDRPGPSELRPRDGPASTQRSPRDLFDRSVGISSSMSPTLLRRGLHETCSTSPWASPRSGHPGFYAEVSTRPVRPAGPGRQGHVPAASTQRSPRDLFDSRRRVRLDAASLASTQRSPRDLFDGVSRRPEHASTQRSPRDLFDGVSRQARRPEHASTQRSPRDLFDSRAFALTAAEVWLLRRGLHETCSTRLRGSSHTPRRCGFYAEVSTRPVRPRGESESRLSAHQASTQRSPRDLFDRLTAAHGCRAAARFYAEVSTRPVRRRRTHRCPGTWTRFYAEVSTRPVRQPRRPRRGRSCGCFYAEVSTRPVRRLAKYGRGMQEIRTLTREVPRMKANKHRFQAAFLRNLPVCGKNVTRAVPGVFGTT